MDLETHNLDSLLEELDECELNAFNERFNVKDKLIYFIEYKGLPLTQDDREIIKKLIIDPYKQSKKIYLERFQDFIRKIQEINYRLIDKEDAFKTINL